MSEIKTCEHYVLATLATREQELEHLQDRVRGLEQGYMDLLADHTNLVELLKKYIKITDDSVHTDYIWKRWDSEDYEFLKSLLGENDDRTEGTD